MVIDSLINPQTLLQPRSLAGLVTLYESNFLRLKMLIPDFDTLSNQRLAATADDCHLHVELEERSTYTLTFSMTYLFRDGDRIVREPDMRIRVYTDANLAEALSVSSDCVGDLLAQDARQQFRELDNRWAINTMLNKWLDYCLEQGYRF